MNTVKQILIVMLFGSVLVGCGSGSTDGSGSNDSSTSSSNDNSSIQTSQLSTSTQTDESSELVEGNPSDESSASNETQEPVAEEPVVEEPVVEEPAQVTYTVRVKWNAPAERTDSTGMTTAEIAQYQIIYHPENNEGALSVEMFSATSTKTDGDGFYRDLELAEPGSYVFTIRCVDTEGNTSDESAPFVISVS